MEDESADGLRATAWKLLEDSWSVSVGVVWCLLAQPARRSVRRCSCFMPCVLLGPAADCSWWQVFYQQVHRSRYVQISLLLTCMSYKELTQVHCCNNTLSMPEAEFVICWHSSCAPQVAQHGIRAILAGGSQQELEPLGDISGGDATWKAWKLVELHTAQVCVCVHACCNGLLVLALLVSLQTSLHSAAVYINTFNQFSWVLTCLNAAVII